MSSACPVKIEDLNEPEVVYDYSKGEERFETIFRT
jgi:hypothetical protein